MNEDLIQMFSTSFEKKNKQAEKPTHNIGQFFDVIEREAKRREGLKKATQNRRKKDG